MEIINIKKTRTGSWRFGFRTNTPLGYHASYGWLYTEASDSLRCPTIGEGSGNNRSASADQDTIRWLKDEWKARIALKGGKQISEPLEEAASEPETPIVDKDNLRTKVKNAVKKYGSNTRSKLLKEPPSAKRDLAVQILDELYEEYDVKMAEERRKNIS